MRYYSTQSPTEKISLKNALFKGLAPDKGLYMPEYIPTFDDKFLVSLADRSFQEICFHIASLFLSDDIDKHNLRKIVETSINDPGDTFRSTFVDLMLVTSSISQSILL